MRIAVLLKICLAGSLTAALAACEEPTDPTLTVPEVSPPAGSATAPGAALTPPGPRSPSDYRRLADGGDIASMLLLARSHESLGQTDMARRWYQKAADAGSDTARAALANLDAPTSRPGATTAPGGSAAPTAVAGGVAGTAGAPQAGAATQPRMPTTTLAPDPTGKFRWIDVAALFNDPEFISDSRPNVQGRFIGIISARDNTITAAASGATNADLTEVTVVIRVKNKQDPGSSPRLGQAAALCARVTADNVNQRDVLQWVTTYLQTEQRSEPILRNGWLITVSGSAAEGRRDKMIHLGSAVVIEMKK